MTGRRLFANEAADYNSLDGAFHQLEATRYGGGPARPAATRR
jgi:hypothetical protein